MTVDLEVDTSWRGGQLRTTRCAAPPEEASALGEEAPTPLLYRSTLDPESSREDDETLPPREESSTLDEESSTLDEESVTLDEESVTLDVEEHTPHAWRRAVRHKSRFLFPKGLATPGQEASTLGLEALPSMSGVEPRRR
jgi:hypothetical protein